jgi:hypothetical protein
LAKAWGGGGAAHVGGGAEDDGVGGVEPLPVLVGGGVHRDVGDLGSRILGATLDSFGQHGGVSVAGVEGDGDQGALGGLGHWLAP